jgi:DNA-binding HxlR family transcriptional regulator
VTDTRGTNGLSSQAVDNDLRGTRGNGARPQNAGSVRHCPAGSAIEILQEKWVLHIVHALLDGPKGFNELGREVGGCNPTTLAQRLARLENLGVVSREVLQGEANGAGLPRCSYELSESGRDLEAVIEAIRAWAAAHLVDLEPEAPS